MTERTSATPERHVPGLVDLFVKLGYKDAVALFEGVTNIIVAQRSEIATPKPCCLTGFPVDTPCSTHCSPDLRNAVLGEAARVCDDYDKTGHSQTALELASAIRALIAPTAAGDGE